MQLILINNILSLITVEIYYKNKVTVTNILQANHFKHYKSLDRLGKTVLERWIFVLMLIHYVFLFCFHTITTQIIKQILKAFTSFFTPIFILRIYHSLIFIQRVSEDDKVNHYFQVFKYKWHTIFQWFVDKMWRRGSDQACGCCGPVDLTTWYSSKTLIYFCYHQ